MTTFKDIYRRVLEAYQRRQVRAELVRLDERSLWDIGMNRADVDMRFG